MFPLHDPMVSWLKIYSRNSGKSYKAYQQVNEWQSQASYHKSEQGLLEAAMSELNEASEILRDIRTSSIAMEKSAKELLQSSLKLVDEYEELSNISFKVVHCAKLLQSGVLKPMTGARLSLSQSYRQQTLHSTQRMIEVLEKSSIGWHGLSQLRSTQALLEAGSTPGQSGAVVGRLSEI